MSDKSLLSDRAKAIMHLRAQLDVEGSHDYDTSLIDTMMKRIEAELVQEYEIAFQRHVRLMEEE